MELFPMTKPIDEKLPEYFNIIKNPYLLFLEKATELEQYSVDALTEIARNTAERTRKKQGMNNPV